jgi:hypothetical protein
MLVKRGQKVGREAASGIGTDSEPVNNCMCMTNMLAATLAINFLLHKTAPRHT